MKVLKVSIVGTLAIGLLATQLVVPVLPATAVGAAPTLAVSATATDEDSPRIAPPGEPVSPPQGALDEHGCSPGGVSHDPGVSGTWNWCSYQSWSGAPSWHICDDRSSAQDPLYRGFMFQTWQTADGMLGACLYPAALPAKGLVKVLVSKAKTTLTVRVSPVVKGIKKPHGKKLVTVTIGKKTIKASLSKKGVAKVKLPKGIKKGTVAKVVFVGTTKLTGKTVRYKL